MLRSGVLLHCVDTSVACMSVAYNPPCVTSVYTLLQRTPSTHRRGSSGTAMRGARRGGGFSSSLLLSSSSSSSLSLGGSMPTLGFWPPTLRGAGSSSDSSSLSLGGSIPTLGFCPPGVINGCVRVRLFEAPEVVILQLMQHRCTDHVRLRGCGRSSSDSDSSSSSFFFIGFFPL